MKLPTIKNLSPARDGWLDAVGLVAGSRADAISRQGPAAGDGPDGPRASTATIAQTIQRALASAGLDGRSGPINDATRTIRHALSSAGLDQGDATQWLPPMPATIARVESGARRPLAARRSDVAAHPTSPGAFTSHTFSGANGTRDYKLYVPTGHATGTGTPAPMVVMLHGCTQSPDDFAAGTRMNALAELHGFLVVYPAQAANANGSKCWNWFRPQDQQRDQGEPALIAGITREVAARHRVDSQRIFVAGLSAGAAMAVILGVTYPELYTAVGAHSGLPYRAAHDMPSAFGAMNGAAARTRNQPGTHATASNHRTPTIVFHGDRDHTVDVRNATAIVEQAAPSPAGGAPLPTRQRAGTSSGGATWQQTSTINAEGQPVVEHWLLHGAGHAWSGGSPAGSFTDARGPDASAEMVRFFLAQGPAGA